MARIKKPVEAAPGKFAALPHVVLDSPAYTGATPTAKALLNEILRQHNGQNNGRFHLAHTWLAGRGWPSKSTVEKARDELIERGLITQTKQGGLFIGPTWYAVTWLNISNFAGLEIGSHQYHPGAWQFCDQPPTTRRKPPMKKISQPVHRGSPDPTTGAASQHPDPYTGAINPVLAHPPTRTPGTMYITNTPRQFNRDGWKLIGWAHPGTHPQKPLAIFRSTHHGHTGHPSH